MSSSNQLAFECSFSHHLVECPEPRPSVRYGCTVIQHLCGVPSSSLQASKNLFAYHDPLPIGGLDARHGCSSLEGARKTSNLLSIQYLIPCVCLNPGDSLLFLERVRVQSATQHLPYPRQLQGTSRPRCDAKERQSQCTVTARLGQPPPRHDLEAVLIFTIPLSTYLSAQHWVFFLDGGAPRSSSSSLTDTVRCPLALASPLLLLQRGSPVSPHKNGSSHRVRRVSKDKLSVQSLFRRRQMGVLPDTLLTELNSRNISSVSRDCRLSSAEQRSGRWVAF